MPSIVTHTYFGRDVYKKLKPKIRKKLDSKYYLSFTKGSDVFNHSTLYIFIGKQIRKSSKRLHKEKREEFLITYIDHILKYRLERNKEIVGSLYGMITHYYLDKYTEPLIQYKTKNDITKKLEMDRLIDLYMLEKREKVTPYKIKLQASLFPSIKFSPSLKNLLTRVYHDTYGIDKMGNYYFSSLKEMKVHYKLFYYDRFKIKIKIYNLLTNILSDNKKWIKYIPFSNDLRSKVSYINFEHDKWNYLNKTSTDSFFDLYNSAITDCVKTINICNSILNGDEELKTLEKTLLNNKK